MKKFYKKEKSETKSDYKCGTVLFDTEAKKDVTPGEYKTAYGTATNIRWWDFAENRKLQLHPP